LLSTGEKSFRRNAFVFSSVINNPCFYLSSSSSIESISEYDDDPDQSAESLTLSTAKSVAESLTLSTAKSVRASPSDVPTIENTVK
jgi:hypothetical protein